MKRAVLIGLCVIGEGDAFTISLAVGGASRDVQKVLYGLREIGYVEEDRGKYRLTDAGNALAKGRFLGVIG